MSTAYPPAALPDTQARALTSRHTGETYRLAVALPPRYGESDRRYPTLYVLDAAWFLGTPAELLRLLSFEGRVPQLLIVGLAYTQHWLEPNQRARDYAPVAWTDDPRSGGAEAFARFFREELIPLIEAEYRVNDDRGLWGHSLGGLFGLYALLYQPTLFQRYILSSPWIDRDGAAVRRAAADPAALPADVATRVFMAIGSRDEANVVANLQAVAQTLSERAHPGLQLTTQVWEGEGHLSVLPLTLHRGAQEVYR